MRIAFRTDASDAIGTGHLARCLTLADALAAAGHECRFVMRQAEGSGAVEARGHSIAQLPAAETHTRGDLPHSAWLGVPQERDAEETLAAIADEAWDWVLADHYALDRRWERALRASGARLMAIDDLADRDHDCDLLLDQNLQGAPDRYARRVAAHCELLLGPRFALLRPEFAALRKAPGNPAGPLLVYFGGVDAAGATLLALEGIERAGLAARGVTVVAGERNPHLAAIRAWTARNGARLHEAATDLAPLMGEARAAIGAAGATAWERCCLGLPTILLTIADNQRPGAAALAKVPAAIWLGDAADCSAEAVAGALLTLDRAPDLAGALSREAAALVDGQGTARVVKAMEQPALSLRPAGEADCDTVWRWRNAPEVRARSHDPAEIALEAHRAWYACALADPARRIYLGERAGEGVGVVRFDRTGDCALVSIFLAPAQGGKGTGSALLSAGCREIAREWPDVAWIDAEVLADNPASARIFGKAGFQPASARLRYDLRG